MINLIKMRRKRKAGVPFLIPCCFLYPRQARNLASMHEYFSGIYNFAFCIFHLLHLIMAAKINNEDVSKAWLIITEVLSPAHANVRVIPSSTQ